MHLIPPPTVPKLFGQAEVKKVQCFLWRNRLSSLEQDIKHPASLCPSSAPKSRRLLLAPFLSPVPAALCHIFSIKNTVFLPWTLNCPLSPHSSCPFPSVTAVVSLIWARLLNHDRVIMVGATELFLCPARDYSLIRNVYLSGRLWTVRYK